MPPLTARRLRLYLSTATWIGLLSGGALCVDRLWSADKPTKPQAQADKPTPVKPGGEAAEDQPQPTVIRDVTKDFEIVPVSPLRSLGSQRLGASIRLRYRGTQPVNTPLALILEGATIAEPLHLADSTGELPDGRRFLDIDSEFKPGATSAIQRVHLGTDNSLSAEERDALTLALARGPVGQVQPKPAPNQAKLRVIQLPAEIVSERDHNSLLPGKSYTRNDMERVRLVAEAWSDRLFKHTAVRGHGVSEDAQGRLNITVFSDRAGISRELPGALDGVPVKITFVPGGFRAGPDYSGVTYEDGVAKSPATLNKEASTLATKTLGTAARWPRPIPIGVSAFNVSTNLCATGTLGCRVVDSAGTTYALSNNHVFALENAGKRQVDAITQPGPLDPFYNTNRTGTCGLVAADKIGTLWDFQIINAKDNLMDAGIMKVESKSVGFATPPTGYGAPATGVNAFPIIGTRVQKVGRTTGYTIGNVIALNVKVDVGYDFGLASFINQISIASPGLNFSNSGDSGSLVVGNPDRRPVGLLFAGGGGTTIICPIQPILKRFNVNVDDGSGAGGNNGSGRGGNAGGK